MPPPFGMRGAHRPAADPGREDDVARGVANPRGVVAIALVHHRIEQPKPIERAQRRPGDGDAGAIDAPVLVDLGDLSGDAGALQHNGERHAGNAAAEDQDAFDIAHRKATGIEREGQLPHRSCHRRSPMVQEMRGAAAATGTIRRSGVRPAISSTSLVRIASLN